MSPRTIRTRVLSLAAVIALVLVGATGCMMETEEVGASANALGPPEDNYYIKTRVDDGTGRPIYHCLTRRRGPFDAPFVVLACDGSYDQWFHWNGYSRLRQFNLATGRSESIVAQAETVLPNNPGGQVTTQNRVFFPSEAAANILGNFVSLDQFSGRILASPSRLSTQQGGYTLRFESNFILPGMEIHHHYLRNAGTAMGIHTSTISSTDQSVVWYFDPV